MTFSKLRNQVDALMIKYATELEVYRTQPIVQQFCDEMADAVTGSDTGPGKPVLEWARTLVQRFSGRGFRLRNFPRFYDYLVRCLDCWLLPLANDVQRLILPKARDRSLIPRSLQEVPFRPRRVWPPGMGYFAPILKALAARSAGRYRSMNSAPVSGTHALRYRPAVPATAFRATP